MRTLKGIGKMLALVALFATLAFFRADIAGFFARARSGAAGVADAGYGYSEFVRLKLENASLKKSLAAGGCAVSPARGKTLEAGVYSRYPFNDKNALVIDKGAADGVVAGMPVFAAGDWLVGRVRDVKRYQSEVVTIFDPSWKSSVTVGAAGSSTAKAVLAGGNAPYIDLIPKTATVREADPVANLAPEFPLGASLGAVGKPKDDAKKMWRMADLDVPYDVAALDRVSVLLDFKD